MIVLVLLGIGPGCSDQFPGKPDPAERPRTPAQLTSFPELFQQNCSGCHGADGTLGPAPPLNDPIFLSIVPEASLLEVITNGRPGTPMPAFARRLEGALTDAQITIIAAGLKKDWKSTPVTTGTVPPYLGSAPPTTASKAPEGEAIARGEKLFAQACALCHGENGAGPGDDSSPGKINDQALLSLISDQALRRIIITGRPDLGMPDFAGSDGRESDFQPLTSAQIDDLVALLAHWRTSGRQVAARP